MPRMNSVEATSELRAMMPRVPIVLFTMYDDAVGRASALSAGASLVVSKPSGGWKLIECVQSLLQAARSPASETHVAGGFPAVVFMAA